MAKLPVGLRARRVLFNSNTLHSPPYRNNEWQREKRRRTILCEEIMGLLVKKWPGQTAADKRAKADMIENLFQIRSWTKVEDMSSDILQERLGRLRTRFSEEETKTF